MTLQRAESPGEQRVELLISAVGDCGGGSRRFYDTRGGVSRLHDPFGTGRKTVPDDPSDAL